MVCVWGGVFVSCGEVFCIVKGFVGGFSGGGWVFVYGDCFLEFFLLVFGWGYEDVVYEIKS